MKPCRLFLILFVCLLPVLRGGAYAHPPKAAKVLVRAGASHTVGEGLIEADPKRNQGKEPLEYLADDAANAVPIIHLMVKDVMGIERKNVWMWYLDKKTPLLFRKDLGAKNLLFVIAETGMSRNEEKNLRTPRRRRQVPVAESGVQGFWRPKNLPLWAKRSPEQQRGNELPHRNGRVRCRETFAPA